MPVPNAMCITRPTRMAFRLTLCRISSIPSRSLPKATPVLDIENSVVWNSLCVQSEVMVARTDRTVNEGPNVTFWGGYLQASYFLTGEYRPYDRYQGYLSRVYPNERFFTADIRKAVTARLSSARVLGKLAAASRTSI